jgi:hypothetical protein
MNLITFVMSKREIAKKYIDYLEQGKTEYITELFSKSGKVTSPIYGTMIARDFYKELNNDTLNSKLELKGIFEEENSNTIALYFNYNWVLKNKKNVKFDVVDIVEFNSKNEIIHLHIIYDTVISRGLVNNIRRNK